jgi:uncharacterized protein
MALTFNLRHLEKQDLHLEGDLSPVELEVTEMDDLVAMQGPLHYDLAVERLSDSVLVQGSLHADLACQCARCLKPFAQHLDLEHWTIDLPLEGEEKVVVSNDCVDLTPYIREDILLAFPQHPLCGPDCRGLLEATGGQKQPASLESSASRGSSAWAELNKLKL